MEVAMARHCRTVVRALALTFVIGLACGAFASAQDRLPPLPADKLTPAQKKAVDDYKKARGGEPGGPWAVLTRSPELMSRTLMLSDYLRFNSTLPPRLSEFVILMTAREWGQNYEWNAHHSLALKGGLSPEIAKAVAEGRRPAQMAEDEASLYDLIQELLRNRTVSDSTYSRAVSKFGEQAVVDAVSISGYYTMVAMLLNTARTPLAAGVSPPLPAFP
jgi:4-carboxymuconolactone decarboxylase